MSCCQRPKTCLTQIAPLITGHIMSCSHRTVVTQNRSVCTTAKITPQPSHSAKTAAAIHQQKLLRRLLAAQKLPCAKHHVQSRLRDASCLLPCRHAKEPNTQDRGGGIRRICGTRKHRTREKETPRRSSGWVQVGSFDVRITAK